MTDKCQVADGKVRLLCSNVPNKSHYEETGNHLQHQRPDMPDVGIRRRRHTAGAIPDKSPGLRQDAASARNDP